MEKYQLVQRLGQGAFAVVWKARRKSDGRLVAVKQLRQSPESWEACKQLPEVRAAAAISDRRHVILMLEAVRDGGELFLVFEYCESSLHACAALGQRIDEAQVRWAGHRLLAALAAVHQAGLVHCDVKPENILVGMDGGNGMPTMKLCDFGQTTDAAHIGTYVGTRWYRPPELLLGSRGDASVDLWAAGCVLAELFLRRPLFPGSDIRDMCFKISGELGPPDDSWPLSSKLLEASGRPNAEAAAWASLAQAGASEAGVCIIESLLRYNGPSRTRADRALKEAPFFTQHAPEVPIAVPPARPMSPESLRNAREEAAVVERRLRRAANSSTSKDSPQQLPRLQAPARSPMPAAPAADGGGGYGMADVEAARLSDTGEFDDLPGNNEGGDSDDEALAEMFWGVCKTGNARQSPDLPESGSDEDHKYDIAEDRGRARRARPLGGSGVGSASTASFFKVPSERVVP